MVKTHDPVYYTSGMYIFTKCYMGFFTPRRTLMDSKKNFVHVHIIRTRHYATALYLGFTLNMSIWSSHTDSRHLLHLRIIAPHPSLDFLFPVRAEPHNAVFA